MEIQENPGAILVKDHPFQHMSFMDAQNLLFRLATRMNNITKRGEIQMTDFLKTQGSDCAKKEFREEKILETAVKKNKNGTESCARPITSNNLE